MAWNKINKKNLEKLYNYDNYDKETFNKFLQENNIVSYSRHPQMVSWEFFLTKGKDVGLVHFNEGLPPRDDHGYAFKNDKQEVFYIYQPYFSVNEIENEVKSWAKNLNLECLILDKRHSWYNKGNTCLVVIYSKYTTKPIIF